MLYKLIFIGKIVLNANIKYMFISTVMVTQRLKLDSLQKSIEILVARLIILIQNDSQIFIDGPF